MLKDAYSVGGHNSLGAAGAGLDDEAAQHVEAENKEVLTKVTRNIIPLGMLFTKINI